MFLRTNAIGAILLCFAYGCLGQESLRSREAQSFRIDSGRPYIYLQFLREQDGVQRSENEPKMRFWFRLVNNCRVPVEVRTYPVPKGSPADEIGVMHEVVLDTKLEGVSSTEPLVETIGSAKHSTGEAMPRGYMFEVGSSKTIAPGASVLFSVPVNHLSRNWHIEVPYRFDLKEALVPQPYDIGGEPIMRLAYGIWYLPENIQKSFPSR